ncbi:Caspase 6, apoptosis-related cysteine peptidase, like 2 [Apostichopus japonicus]|uniref:Caspase 6, apoptosis-related cysteine peptidase, like 2 n=1 Tax=Stichopus japonicus TaxID=307972 RepID=A0A2G8LRH4_STIJA|nr:Caspase 6, apoptosis-related cysteine peptidase, like 2 [Apostichopus japonicus]
MSGVSLVGWYPVTWSGAKPFPAGPIRLNFACRGTLNDTPVQVGGGAQANYVNQEEGVKVTIPTEADFLICYSSTEGFVSYRDHEKGTWFIQELTRVLNEFGESKDFIQILTVVNKLVSERTMHLSGEKQMPCFLSRLTKKLCFPKKTIPLIY